MDPEVVEELASGGKEEPATPERRHGIDIFHETRPMWTTMAIFLIPLMASNILQSAQQLFNSILVGQLLGVNALAAISAFFPIFFLLFSFLIGLSNGATVLVGQAFGARDMHKTKQVTGTALFMSLALGAAVAIVGLLLIDGILRAVGTPPNIMADTVQYARVFLFASPLFFLYIMYITIVRGVGDAITPFIFLTVTTIVGVFFTAVFIRGWFNLPTLAVTSAAYAAVVGNLAGFVGMLFYLRARKSPLALDYELVTDLRFDRELSWKIVKIGVPTGLQVVMVSLAEIAVLSFVNHFGSHATAAYGAVNQVVSYVQFPAISISIAASIFAAQCIGARREDKLRDVIHSGVGLMYAIVGTLVLICYLFSWNIMGWFITDASTLATAHTLLMITLWSYLLFGNSAVISGIMRASGTVLVPTLNGIIAIWGVEVPVAYVLMQKIGLPGIWIGYPAAFAFVLTLQFTYYTFVWKRRTHERLV
ncbi:MAG: MATE family efflux transporter [Candidatus Eremiobacteraeota bacterium]|nr:MATE family efflux transporter [Candidatus Eremiobacteraeota bacterium]